MKDCGHITISDPGSDKPLEVVKTVQCVHCGGHFPFGPGYTKHRGWCYRCNGAICGAKCLDCVPIEQWLENVEKGRPEWFTPVSSYCGLALPWSKHVEHSSRDSTE
jgi:hypothetical protein